MCFVECYFYIKVSFPSLKSGGSQSDGRTDGQEDRLKELYIWNTVKCSFLSRCPESLGTDLDDVASWCLYDAIRRSSSSRSGDSGYE